MLYNVGKLPTLLLVFMEFRKEANNSLQSFATSGYSMEKTQALPRVHVAWHPTADLGNTVIDSRYFYPDAPLFPFLLRSFIQSLTCARDPGQCWEHEGVKMATFTQ